MRRKIYEPGTRFPGTRLTVLENLSSSKDGESRVLCLCDCGHRTQVYARNIVKGRTKSCGCLQRERNGDAHRKHGYEKHPIYGIWKHIIKRCECKNDKDYPNYGGRGIMICDVWRRDAKTFIDWALENGYAKGLQIDRRDNDKGYSPENCRFVTSKENNRNRRDNRLITINGETKCMSQWAEEAGIDVRLIFGRLKKGWKDVTLLRPARK